MAHRHGRPKIPIIVCGWHDALTLIRNGQFSLLELADGHGELLLNAPGSPAVFYLRKRSVELLKEHMEPMQSL